MIIQVPVDKSLSVLYKTSNAFVLVWVRRVQWSLMDCDCHDGGVTMSATRGKQESVETTLRLKVLKQ